MHSTTRCADRATNRVVICLPLTLGGLRGQAFAPAKNAESMIQAIKILHVWDRYIVRAYSYLRTSLHREIVNNVHPRDFCALILKVSDDDRSVLYYSFCSEKPTANRAPRPHL